MNEHLKILKKYRKYLTRQQILTLRGQVINGDIEGFKKGLSNLLRRKNERRT